MSYTSHIAIRLLKPIFIFTLIFGLNDYSLIAQSNQIKEWEKEFSKPKDTMKNLAFEKAKAQLNLAELHIKRRSYTKADSLLSESESYFEETDDLLWKSITLNTKGILYFDQGDYDSALHYFSEVLKIGKLEQVHLIELEKDSLNSVKKNDLSISQTNAPLNSQNILIGVFLLGLFIGLPFFYFNKNRKKEISSTDKKSFDQTKIDQYFEKLFARLDHNKTASESKEDLSQKIKVNPIKDMTEFLRDKLTSPNDWVSFELYFEKVHKDFFKNLKSNYPTISVNELNMCALLKLNLRNKDIAQIMGISPDSVRKAQNRLSKRLELSSDVVLRDFVIKL